MLLFTVCPHIKEQKRYKDTDWEQNGEKDRQWGRKREIMQFSISVIAILGLQ